MVRNKKEGLMYTDNVTEKDVTGIGLSTVTKAHGAAL